jgi:hypothetical protein
MRTFLQTAFLFTGIIVLSSFTNIFHGDNSKTILFIPYQPVMHLSDADADIAENSKVNVQRVRVLMRNAINERLIRKLRENFCVRQLMEIGTAKDDLNNFFDSESFYLSSRDTTRKNSGSEVASAGNPYFGIFGKSSRPDYASSYMNVSLSKPVLFKELSSEYEADYFVVLTQFEIKTQYTECIDIANRIFRREFLVHFSVFDAEGNQTAGTAVSYDAGPEMSSIIKISGSVFPELAEKISAHVTSAASQ